MRLVLLSVSHLLTHATVRRRIWNTSTGQCLKTLAEGHDAIWYGLHNFQGNSVLTSLLPANTSNSLQTQNTYSPLHTTALSDYGITKHRDASRRTPDM
jgi:hypothetical protein